MRGTCPERRAVLQRAADMGNTERQASRKALGGSSAAGRRSAGVQTGARRSCSGPQTCEGAGMLEGTRWQFSSAAALPTSRPERHTYIHTPL